jgi:hypothetical protein
MEMPKFTFGSGDRFAHQGRAQLQAVIDANAAGIDVCPVWNKSNREHSIIGSKPDDLRAEADSAVNELGWKRPYFVDADHINLSTVDRFVAASDFYTIDVADYTGKPCDAASVDAFVTAMSRYVGTLEIPGIKRPFAVEKSAIEVAARKFLLAMKEAGKIYNHIEAAKGADNFVAEVSVDETDTPQTPIELFFILAMLAGENFPVQTIAPKFTGRFNKGVDYVGDIAKFEQEFDEDLSVIAFAIREFHLPETLKLSVHSGSDKFSIYPAINRQIKRHGAGLHVKTAGTTWLEEVIGLAESGGTGLELAAQIYGGAFGHFDELTAPYATVIDIDRARLPDPATVATWDAATFAATLRHDLSCPAYNAHFRQLIHVAFKIAASMGEIFTAALREHSSAIGRNVHHNLLERHIRPIFG